MGMRWESSFDKKFPREKMMDWGTKSSFFPEGIFCQNLTLIFYALKYVLHKVIIQLCFVCTSAVLWIDFIIAITFQVKKYISRSFFYSNISLYTNTVLCIDFKVAITF